MSTRVGFIKSNLATDVSDVNPLPVVGTGGVTPTAAALADATANPTTTLTGAPIEIYNGATWDRAREATADAMAATGILAAGEMIYNGATWDRAREVAGDAQAAAGIPAHALMGWNGTTYDRLQVDSAKNLKVGIVATNGNEVTATGASADNIGAGSIAIISLALGAGFTGNVWERQRYLKVFKPQAAVAVNPEATVWTPTTGKKFRLMRAFISGSVAGDYTLKDNTAGTAIAIITLAAGVSVNVDFGNGILSAAANNVLTVTGPALSTLSGTIMGTEE